MANPIGDISWNTEMSLAPAAANISAACTAISRHGPLVVAPGAINFYRRNAPGIQLVLLHFEVVVVIGEAFAETADAHAPLAGLLQRILEIRAEPAHVHSARPAFPASSALITVAAHKIFLLRFHVAETRNINSIRTIAKRHLVFVTRHRSARARSHMMVHQVVAQLAAAVGQSIGEFRAGRI